jgi:O-acetyl-ADP-ribose deacetylase (regulator of RNase III)
MQVQVVCGDLLDQDVDAIVNAWNRNPFPWWLLIPQGVSAGIRKRAGTAPFRELRRFGLLRLGEAVLTSAGRLPHRAIIHVAGINLLWRATERSIELSVRNAITLAQREGFRSIAFPLIGGGTGGRDTKRVEQTMLRTLDSLSFDGDVVIVRHQRSAAR